MIGTGLINKSNLLCVVDYHGQFLFIKFTENLSAGSLIKCCKIYFAEYELPRKIISDTGTNFISEIFKEFFG